MQQGRLYSNCQRSGLSGDRIPLWATFSAPDQTCPEDHTAFCKMGTCQYQKVNCGRRVTLTPQIFLVRRSKLEENQICTLPKGLRSLLKCETYLIKCKTQGTTKKKIKNKQHLKKCRENQTAQICEKFVQNPKSLGTFILGIILYLLHLNKTISNKHIFTNSKIILNFTKTTMESVLQQNTVIYKKRLHMNDLVLITHYGN